MGDDRVTVMVSTREVAVLAARVPVGEGDRLDPVCSGGRSGRRPSGVPRVDRRPYDGEESS
jgi:hypothetical protein